MIHEAEVQEKREREGEGESRCIGERKTERGKSCD